LADGFSGRGADDCVVFLRFHCPHFLG
jgi:hypothetical protein